MVMAPNLPLQNSICWAEKNNPPPLNKLGWSTPDLTLSRPMVSALEIIIMLFCKK